MSTASPWKRNPYVIGVPIADRQLFFGREVLLQFIEDNLRQGTTMILLYGQRRIGKSSVLAQIPAFIGSEQFCWVSFDWQNQGNRPLGHVLHALATAIVEQLEADFLGTIPIPAAADLTLTPTRFSQEFLPQVMTHLAPRRLVWLLDEFDVLADDTANAAIDQILPYLNSLTASSPHLHLIPTIGRRPEELPTLLNFFKSAPAQEVGLLDETSAIQLITRPAIGLLQYEPAAISAILHLTAGHPYFTQVVCFNLFGQARQHDRWTVTAADVSQSVNRAIDSSRPGLTWFRDSLPIPERVMFSAVAEAQELARSSSLIPSPIQRLKACGIVPTPALQQSGDRLVKWGFLETMPICKNDATVTHYHVKIEFVRQWLLMAYPLTNAAWELERLSPEAQRWYDAAVQQQQAGDVPTALQSYQQALHHNPNHFSAGLAAAELYLEAQDWAEAVSLYQRIFKLEPIRSQEGLIRSRLGYGQALMQQGKFNLARTQFLQVLDIEPQHSLAQHWLQRAETQISQTFLAATNPFTVGQPAPIDRFVGRQAELATAIEQIERGGHVAIWGGTGIGKTSFLHQLACLSGSQSWRGNAHPVMVLVSCRHIMPTFTSQGFWLDVFERLGDRLTASSEPDFSLMQQVEQCLQQQSTSAQTLHSIARQLARHGKNLVLLIDDYDIALQPNPSYHKAEIDWFLREWVAAAADPAIATVVASSQRLDQLCPKSSSADLFRHYLLLPLPPFSVQEAQTLLDWVTLADSTLRSGILALVDGNPALLQLAGSFLYTELRNGHIPTLQQFVPAFQQRAAPFLQAMWSQLHPQDQALLQLLVLESQGFWERSPTVDRPISAISPQYESALMRLEADGLLRQDRTAAPPRFSIAASALEGWLIQQLQSNRPNEPQSTLSWGPPPLLPTIQPLPMTDTNPPSQPSISHLPSFAHWMYRFIQSIDRGA
jgi:tetratricopeptide (TPR) repeat protein